MADQSDVRRVALALPDAVAVDGRFAFAVRTPKKDKAFVWAWLERVHPKKARVPSDAVVAVRVADEEEKSALLAADRVKFFTEPHYDGYPAVLVRLAAVSARELEAILAATWRCQATPAQVRAFDQRGDSPGPATPAKRAARPRGAAR